MAATRRTPRDLRDHRPATSTRHTGWTVAALVAPATAALFAGTVSWSAGQAPELVEKTSATTEKPATDDAAQVAQLQQQLYREQVRVYKLRKQVTQLRTKLKRYEKPAATPTGSPSTGGGTTGTAPKAGTTPKTTAPKAPSAPEPPPTTTTKAPAPTTNTSTAAS